MRMIAEWLWRGTLLAALAWIGLELHWLHLDLLEPAADETVASAGPDTEIDPLDSIRDDVADIKQKVTAIMVVMTRAK